MYQFNPKWRKCNYLLYGNFTESCNAIKSENWVTRETIKNHVPVLVQTCQGNRPAKTPHGSCMESQSKLATQPSSWVYRMVLLQCLREMTDQKLPYYQSWFHYLSAHFNKSTNIYEQLHVHVIDEVTTSRIGKKRRHQYNEYSAKEREDIGKYSADVQ